MATTYGYNTQLATILLEHIRETYERFRGTGNEQTLTVTYLLEYALQHGQGAEILRYATRSKQQRMVRASLERLTRTGHLSVSLGVGLGGREVKAYEPKKAQTMWSI